MNWQKEDAQKTVNEYASLTLALSNIAKLNILREEQAKNLLSKEEFSVWSTFIRPFEPFETDSELITQLLLRSETETLEDYEYELLERHKKWFLENSRKRLPCKNLCPSFFINRAQRYEALVRANAPQRVIREEGRFLAEEMVLYNFALEKLSFNSLKFILAQEKTYKTALAEIKNGRKLSHWMWFIFPQLKGLGKSPMACQYAISNLYEAKAYLEHNVLGARLIEISTALLNLETTNPVAVFGEIDALKLKSSMTLFSLVSKENSVFYKVLQKYFKGEKDYTTLKLLRNEEN